MNLFGDKKKTIIIISFIAILVAAIILGIYIFDKAVEQVKESRPISETDQVLIDMGIPQEDIDKMTEEEKSEVIDNEYYDRMSDSYIYDKGKKEYENADGTMKTLLTYAGQFNFSSIINQVKPLTERYNFTTNENRQIIEIYNDAKMLTNVYTLSDAGYRIVMYNLTSPIIFTGLYLSAPSDLVKDYTYVQTAHYPLYNGVISFSFPVEKTVEELKTTDNYSLMSDYLNGVSKYYEIQVSGQTTSGRQAPITCYVDKSGTSTFKMVGCFGSSSLLMVGELK